MLFQVIHFLALAIGYIVLSIFAFVIITLVGWFVWGVYIDPMIDKLRTKLTGKPSKYPPKSEGYFTS